MNYSREKYLLLKQLSGADLINDFKQNNVMIAGGAITSIFTNKKINDYDIYFRSKDEYNYINKILENKDKFVKLVSTETADTYKNFEKEITIQLIKLPELFLDNPADIIKEFDFIMCMGIYDFKTDNIILDKDFLKDNSQRRLVFNIEAKYPICSLYRMKKYMNKGYEISGAEIIKLGLCIQKLNIKDYSDLKRHLLGIDTLMLKELTDKLDSDEYAKKEYDFNEFMHFIEEYLDGYDNILS